MLIFVQSEMANGILYPTHTLQVTTSGTHPSMIMKSMTTGERASKILCRNTIRTNPMIVLGSYLQRQMRSLNPYQGQRLKHRLRMPLKTSCWILSSNSTLMGKSFTKTSQVMKMTTMKTTGGMPTFRNGMVTMCLVTGEVPLGELGWLARSTRGASTLIRIPLKKGLKPVQWQEKRQKS